jgi:type I restriction-modification system DNA methylase subunit
LKLRDELQAYVKEDENTSLHLNRFILQLFFLRVLSDLDLVSEHAISAYTNSLLSSNGNPVDTLPKGLAGLSIFTSQYLGKIVSKIPRATITGVIELISKSNLGKPGKMHILDLKVYLLGELFETLKARLERKRRGSFYTPPWLAFQICKHILSSKLKDKENIIPTILSLRVLDNACGGGVFLLAMLENMMQCMNAQYSTEKDLQGNHAMRIIQECLFGRDIDSDALEITEAQLWIALQRFNPSSVKFALVGKNLTAGDTLLHSEPSHDYDIIIGNPPYLRLTRLGPQYRKILSSKYRINREYNVHALFVESALSELKKDGYLGYLLHKNFFTLETYGGLRSRIINSCEVLSMVDCGSGVFPKVTAETAILFVRKKHPGLESQVQLMHTESATETFTSKSQLAQAEYTSIISNWNSRFIIGLEKNDVDPLLVLANYPKLSDVVTISRGIETGDNARFVSHDIEGDMYQPVTRGYNISRFHVDRSEFINYKPRQLAKPGRTDLLKCPKVVLQQNAMGPIAAYDIGTYHVLNSVTYLADAAPEMLKALCVILNSKLVDWFFQLVMTNGSKVTVNILPNNLGPIPLPKRIDTDLFSRLYDALVVLRKEFKRSSGVSDAFEILHQKIAETVVQEAYFLSSKKNVDISRDVTTALEGSPSLQKSLKLSKDEALIARATKRLNHEYWFH